MHLPLIERQPRCKALCGGGGGGGGGGECFCFKLKEKIFFEKPSPFSLCKKTGRSQFGHRISVIER